MLQRGEDVRKGGGGGRKAGRHTKDGQRQTDRQRQRQRGGDRDRQCDSDDDDDDDNYTLAIIISYCIWRLNSYELLALYRSTNAIEHTSTCYLN